MTADGLRSTDGISSPTRVRAGSLRALTRADGVRLQGETVELGSHRVDALCRNHLGRRRGSRGFEGFATGSPAAFEGYESRMPAASGVGHPPFPQPLEPSSALSDAAYTDVSSPYRRLSIRSHDRLLCKYGLPSSADGATNQPIDG